MADFAARDVICPGAQRHISAEECVTATHLVFPYRGVFVHHAGRAETVAEANQVVFLNADEPYRISHPLNGGDSSLSIWIEPAALLELAPDDDLLVKGRPVFNRPRVRIDARAQSLMARLRHGLHRGVMPALEAETLTLALARRALGERVSANRARSIGRQKLTDRAKLLLSSDLGRRWTLTDVAGDMGVSPVYLTQVFQGWSDRTRGPFPRIASRRQREVGGAAQIERAARFGES
jgi:AraC family transcriptional regulator